MISMPAESNSPSAEGPVLSGTFPLSWEQVNPEQLEHQADSIHDSNEITLRNYYLLDDRAHEPLDEHDEASPELLRIEQRLNLVIELLAQVLSHSLTLPPAIPCMLTRNSLEWSSSTTAVPISGECLRLTLYLHSHYPKPLLLFGRVVQVDQSAGATHVTVQLAPLNVAVGDWLDRLIFRAHRRRVALTRRHKSS